MNLSSLGWNALWEARFKELGRPRWEPARVVRQDRGQYQVAAESGMASAFCSGRFLHGLSANLDYPAVGDWVAIEPSAIDTSARLHAVLPRETLFVRKMAGKTHQTQVVAANVATVFLVTGLDQNFNLRRIERYLAVAQQSGAQPVIVLNKSDTCEDLEAVIEAVEEIAAGAPVLPVSAIRGDGLNELSAFLRPAQTTALLGSSGVGKSTLLNALFGEEIQEVREQRARDARGRHTTTARELFALPNGALLIDTPGMRELGMIDETPQADESFADIDEIARHCRFRNCRHETEPGCAIRAALKAETLDPARVESWQKLGGELTASARQRETRLKQEETSRWKRLTLQQREEEQKHLRDES